MSAASANGFMKLFDSHGNAISATDDQLRRIEGLEANDRLLRRIVGDNPGTYWLVSARSGAINRLLQLRLDQLEYNGKKQWYVAIGLHGIAGLPEFDIDHAIERFGAEGSPVPGNVAELARHYVRYDARTDILWQKPGKPRFHSLPLRTLQRRLRKIGFILGRDISPLSANLADRDFICEDLVAEVRPLLLQLGINRLAAPFAAYAVVYAAVPVRVWPRLAYQLAKKFRKPPD